jgi:hypothetical protein
MFVKFFLVFSFSDKETAKEYTTTPIIEEQHP